MKTIEVAIDEYFCPAEFQQHKSSWVANELRKRGIPVVYRTLEQGVARGQMTVQKLLCGSDLYRWTSE